MLENKIITVHKLSSQGVNIKKGNNRNEISELFIIYNKIYSSYNNEGHNLAP